MDKINKKKIRRWALGALNPLCFSPGLPLLLQAYKHTFTCDNSSEPLHQA